MALLDSQAEGMGKYLSNEFFNSTRQQSRLHTAADPFVEASHAKYCCHHGLFRLHLELELLPGRIRPMSYVRHNMYRCVCRHTPCLLLQRCMYERVRTRTGLSRHVHRHIRMRINSHMQVRR